jgi:hypothetical protein
MPASKTTGQDAKRIVGEITRIGRPQSVDVSKGSKRAASETTRLPVKVRLADGTLVNVVIEDSAAYRIYCKAIKGDRLRAAGSFRREGGRRVFFATSAGCSEFRPRPASSKAKKTSRKPAKGTRKA